MVMAAALVVAESREKIKRRKEERDGRK